MYAHPMEQQLLIIGTRSHFGVAGCMSDELRASGNHVEFLELYPPWSRTTPHRAIERLLPSQAPRAHAVNASAVSMTARSACRNAIVTNGRELRAETVREIRHTLESRGGGIACYLCDDPFNPAQGTERWRRSLPEYTVVVSTKRRVMPDLTALGCRAVRYARFGFHPPIHRPIDPSAVGMASIDVAFAGNADSDRLPILKALATAGRDLSIGLFGHGWDRDSDLASICRPPVEGLSYSAAMCAATVCPCLVRRANRDGHVMRSIELPAIGAFMLAERTEEHQEIFVEGVHCEYWASVDELIEKSHWYVRHPHSAKAIARSGHALVTAGGFTYGERARELLRMIKDVTN
jgi:spore maturation protein CgeB